MAEKGESRNAFNESMTCNTLTRLLESWEGEEEVCNKFRVDVVDGFATQAMPILFPFIIEYVLIGASMAFVMRNHIGM